MREVMFRKEHRKFTDNHDFELYGVELPPTIEADSRLLYTGHERDYHTNFDYMHFRYYASTIGRFMKPDNLIQNIANPQSWNLYSYVNGNPVNFYDPLGHWSNVGPDSTYMMNISGASWMNWGAYTNFYNGLYGGNVAFGSGPGGMGSGSQSSGYWLSVTTYEEQTIEMWLQVNEEGYYTLYGQQYFIGTQYDWVVYQMPELIVSSSLLWVNYGEEIQETTMRAQPMPQTYLRARPPDKFHFGHFLYLNAICVPNTMVWTCLGSAIGFKTAGPYGTVFGALGGLAFSEMQYGLLSLYPEGWVPPKEPEAPPVGLGNFTLEPQQPPPPPWKK